MAKCTLTVEIGEPEKTHLTALLSALESQQRQENATISAEKNAQLYADRIRFIDQIKRLYAVVMGFAVISCFSNVYLVMRSMENNRYEAFWVLFAEVSSLLSLIALLYLGAERLLDTRYLHYQNQAPSRLSLAIDLLSLATTAIWFVILANTFPDSRKAPITIDDVWHYQEIFIEFLCILYMIDIIFLIIQWVRLKVSKKDGVPTSKNASYAHGVWIILNSIALFFLVMIWYFLYPKSFCENIHSVWSVDIYWVPLVLLVINVGRSTIDYIATFEFYYPTISE